MLRFRRGGRGAVVGAVVGRSWGGREAVVRVRVCLRACIEWAVTSSGLGRDIRWFGRIAWMVRWTAGYIDVMAGWVDDGWKAEAGWVDGRLDDWLAGSIP